MKRIYAVGILAGLTVLAAALLLAVPKGGTPVGSWEATVDLGGEAGAETSVWICYTFHDDGTYTCAMAPDRESLAAGAQVQGNYQVREDRLYMSESLNYKIDLDVYDRYRLEGDTLTLLENSTADMTGFYPLTLTRVPEE